MSGAYVGRWTNKNTSVVTSLTVTVSGATANNLLFASAAVRFGGETFTTPTGWNLLEWHWSGTHGWATYYRIASGTSADDFALTWTNNGLVSCIVTEYSGLDSTSPFDQSSEDTTNVATDVTSSTTASLSPTNSDGLFIATVMTDQNIAWNDPPEFITTAVNSPFTLATDWDDSDASVPYIGMGYYVHADTTSRSATFTTDDSGEFAYNVISTWDEPAAAGTTINATRDALTLTEYPASINAETSISATVDSLTLTEFAATVSTTTNTEINATVDALTLSEYAADINASTLIQAAVDNLTVSEYQATVQAGNNTVINANTDALTLTEYQANVNAETNIAANTDALTITEYQASISQGAAINAAVDALTLTEFQATVALENTYISASVDTLTLNTFPASINYTGEEEYTYTGGFNVYNRIKSEKEKRQERVEMGIIEDLPKPQQEAVKKAARTENKAVAKSVLSNEIQRLEGDIKRELLQQRTNELIDAYQDELKQILDEISKEQQALIEFNQRNQNAVAVLMMMN